MPVLTCGGMRYQQSWEDIPAGQIEKKNQDNVEATIRHALEMGINHIETARGYGSSEMQLGRILPKLNRDGLLVQTKIHPWEFKDRSLTDVFNQSLKNLQLDYVDFLGIHGLNTPEHLEDVRHGDGFMKEVRQLQREGRVRFVGFSTHAGPEVVVPAIETGAFDYVNLHWYFIYHPMHWPSVEAAAKQDMGVFIISPNDKGGMLYEPTEKLARLCDPLSPMQWNDLYCLSRPEVHTLSIGAAKPPDLDVHVEAVTNWWDERIPMSGKIEQRIVQALEDSLGVDWVAHWHEGLPQFHEAPGEINVREILRLWTYAKALDMTAFGKMRYNLIGNADHWFPGKQAETAGEFDWTEALKNSRFAARIPVILAEAHRMLHDEPKQRLSKSAK